jgi:DNA topoisomerase-1
VHHRELKDRSVARVVRQLLEHRAREVFKYRNGGEEFVDVKGRDINRYIKEVMGGAFSSKDFRTWAGTLTCACALARIGFEENESASARKRKVAQAVRETAEVLGNTPAVCRSAYVSPQVLLKFERGEVLPHFFESADGSR